MRGVTDAFLRTVQGSHVMTARARICSTFQIGTDPDGTEIPILDGDVTLDATANIRGTLQLSTSGRGMWPRKASDPLTVYGNEVFVERGITYGNGLTEWVSQGFYRINGVEQDTSPDGTILLSGADRMAGIIDGRLTNPRQFLAATSIGSIMTILVGEIYPAATIEWPDGGDTALLGRTLLCEEDRFEFLANLVTSAGKVWHWDHRGVLVIKDPPDPLAPVYEVAHGRDGVLVTMSRQITREGVFNAVAAYGEAGDTVPPARGVVVDNNSQSPTYYYGRFGKVPRFYSSPFITTNAQALSAATALLRPTLGIPYSVGFGMVPNPALEPDDTIAISYPARDRSLSSRTENHVIQALTVPLVAKPEMTATTREQTLVTIGEL